jgi:hypothetical protein
VTTSGFGNARDESQVVRTTAASGTDAAADDPRESSTEFERLRELLLGGERRELAAARERIAELERAQNDLPRRLPDAAVEALRSGRNNKRVADALSEPVANALGSAVQKNRQSIVDALFPIIGPMIRRAIAEALRSLVTNLNGAIESSFTPRGLLWRLEAWRGGVPYAQVVLRHRLSYGIDHVFLIEHGSGLVLHQVSAAGVPPLDADAIAGMLTALGDFVDDSVGDDAGGSLDSAQIGEDLVWVEHGPRADLACFMHGVPPAHLRALMEQRLEEVHAQILALPADAPLQSIGDNALVRQLLEPSSLLRDVDLATAPLARRASSRGPLLLIALLALALLGWYVVDRMRWNSRIDALRAELGAHPGFVLASIDAKPWRSVVVRGLFDPDAEPLAPVLEHASLGGAAAKLDLGGYVSADDAVIVRRATRLLAPPASVTLTVHERVLDLSGLAPQAWIDAATQRAAWIAGVARVTSTVTADIDAPVAARTEVERLLATLDTQVVPFVQDAESASGSEETVATLAQTLQRMQLLARVANIEVDLVAIGDNDDSGSSETNARVRAQRAQWLALALAARGIVDVRVGKASDEQGTANRRSAHVRATIREGAQ